MALGARRGTGLLAAPLFFFMAFGAQLIHHIFLLQRTLRLQFFDAACFLRKYGMAYFAVAGLVLVLAMGKRDIAPATAVQFKVFCAFILGGHRANNHRTCYHGDDQYGYYP